jgi:MATE family multidrug resistance protein
VALLAGLRFRGGVTGLWWGLCVGLSAVALALLVRFLGLSARGVAPLVGERREATGP